MVYECYHDELRDKGVTVGGMEFALADAIANDCIEAVQMNLDYNGIESVDDIDGQVVSVFEALKLAKAKALDLAKTEAIRGGATAPMKGSEASPAPSVTESGEAA